MTDTSKDSTMDIECEKSIPTAVDQENNSHLDDSGKQSPAVTSYKNPNVRTFRRSERIRQRRAQESEVARKERLRRNKARHRLRRLEDSQQKTQERRRQDARRAKRRREQETDDERHERQSKNASRERKRREQETNDERHERQVKDASRAERRREQETDDERRERQVKDTIRHRHRRQRSSSFYAAALQNEFPSESYHGRMDKVCRHCNALHFEDECTSDRQDEFKQCCHYGSIQLLELLPYPDEIKVLLQGTDINSRNFRENIRSYNSALAFASMGAEG